MTVVDLGFAFHKLCKLGQLTNSFLSFFMWKVGVIPDLAHRVVNTV